MFNQSQQGGNNPQNNIFANQQNQNSLFGNNKNPLAPNDQNQKELQKPNIFGNNPQATNLFGSNNMPNQSNNLFPNNQPNAPAPTNQLFGAQASTTQNPLFANNNAQQNNVSPASIFGNNKPNPPQNQNQNQPNNPSASLFGAIQPNPNQNPPNNPLNQGGLLGQSQPIQNPNNQSNPLGLFGAAPPQNQPNKPASSGGLFSQSQPIQNQSPPNNNPSNPGGIFSAVQPTQNQNPLNNPQGGLFQPAAQNKDQEVKPQIPSTGLFNQVQPAQNPNPQTNPLQNQPTVQNQNSNQNITKENPLTGQNQIPPGGLFSQNPAAPLINITATNSNAPGQDSKIQTGLFNNLNQNKPLEQFSGNNNLGLADKEEEKKNEGNKTLQINIPGDLGKNNNPSLITTPSFSNATNMNKVSTNTTLNLPKEKGNEISNDPKKMNLNLNADQNQQENKNPINLNQQIPKENQNTPKKQFEKTAFNLKDNFITGGQNTQENIVFARDSGFEFDFDEMNPILKGCILNNSVLFQTIRSDNNNQIIMALENHLIYEKISKGLLFYQNNAEIDSKFKKYFDEGKIKWSDKRPINPLSKDLIGWTSSYLNIELRHSFYLLYFYFSADPSALRHILNYKDNMSDTEKKNTLEIVRKIQIKMTKQIYEEKNCLLWTIHSLIGVFTIQETDMSIRGELYNHLKKNIFTKNYCKILWENYMYLCNQNIPDQYESQQEICDWLENTLEQELWLLKCLFLIYKDRPCSYEMFFQMLNYFDRQFYQGSFLFHNNQRQIQVQESFQKQKKIAENITDICTLIILSNLGMSEVHLIMSSEQISAKNTRPFDLFYNQSHKIYDFFKNTECVLQNAPIFAAWRCFVKLFELFNNSYQVDHCLYKYDLSVFENKFERKNYITYVKIMMKHDIFTFSENYIHAYKSVIKDWVSLLGMVRSDAEIYSNYEIYCDLVCEILDNFQMTEKFWQTDITQKTEFSNFFNKLLRYFPLKGEKLIKIISTLVKENPLYNDDVILLFGKLRIYTTEPQDKDYEPPSNSLLNDHQNSPELHKTLENIGYYDFPIKKDTSYEITSKNIDGEEIPICQHWKIPYNYWGKFFLDWTNFINILCVKQLEDIPLKTMRLIKLVCKLIKNDPSSISSLENSMLIQTNQRVNITGFTIMLLLLDTLYYFQKLKNTPLKLFSHIFQALNSIIGYYDSDIRDKLSLLIQIYPHTVFSLDNRSEQNIHPIFQIIALIQRYENFPELNKKKYKCMLDILNFSHTIFLTNEYPIDLFPDETYFKLISTNSQTSDSIYKASVLIQKLHQTKNWCQNEINNKDNSFDEDQENSNKLFEVKVELFNLMNKDLKIHSTFLDNILNIIYCYITPNFQKFLFSQSEMSLKWKIGNTIFNITELLLKKFNFNIERIPVFINQNIENPLLKLIIKYMNSCHNLSDLILSTFEVCASPDLLKREDISEKNLPGCSLAIQNKNWLFFVDPKTTNYDSSTNLKEMILSGLSLISTIISLMDIYNENKKIKIEKNNFQQFHVSNLNIIEYFFKMLTSKENMHAYTHHYIVNNLSKQIEINFVLSIASLINFEYYTDHLINLNNKSFSAIELESLDEHSIENILANFNFDFNLKPNLLNEKSKLFEQATISSLSIVILSKLVFFWDSLSLSKKPLLFEILNSNSLQSEAGNSIIYNIYREIMIILNGFEIFNQASISILEFISVCIHSQKSFIDIFFKDCTLNAQMPLKTKFNEKFFDFCINVTSGKKSNKLSKQFLFNFTILICELFKKQSNYSSFVERLRKHKSFTQDLIKKVFEMFCKCDQYNISQILEILALNKDLYKKSKDSRDQIQRIKLESIITNEIYNNYAIIAIIQFITNEIINRPSNIEECLTFLFNKSFYNWTKKFTNSWNSDFSISLDRLFDDLRKGENQISRGRFLYFKSTQISKRTNEIIDQTINKDMQKPLMIYEKGIFKIFNFNDFGYGKNFIFDTQELFYNLRLCNYKTEFTYNCIYSFQAYNLHNSISEVEGKCYESWIRLFNLLLTLGDEGIGSSNLIYESGYLYNNKLMVELFKNSKEIEFVNPNYYFKTGFGFSKVFCAGSSEKKDEKTIEFLISIIKLTLEKFDSEDLNNENSRRIFNLKINLLNNCVSGLYFIANRSNLTKNPKILNFELAKEMSEFIIYNLGIIVQTENKEINITNFINLIFTYLSFIDCLPNDESFFLDKNLINYFYELLKKNLECYTLIVYCLLLILRRTDSKNDSRNFIDLITNEYNHILQHVLDKLMQDDTTNQEFLSIIKFLHEICKYEVGCLILKDLNLISDLCFTPKLKDILNVEDYKDGTRNIKHIIWCWVLSLFKDFSRNLINKPGCLNSCLYFIKHFFGRISKILQIPLILNKENTENKLFKANIKLQLPNDYKYSLSYLEELDHILLALSIFFSESKQWTQQNKNHFDLIVLYLSICTVRLFKSNFSYTDNYTPMTKFEKKLNEILGSEKIILDSENLNKNQGFKPSDIVTSTVTPMKSLVNNYEADAVSLKLSSKEKINTLNQYYNPSIYIFKIELTYQNILMSLLYCLTQSLPYSNLYEYFSNQEFNNYQNSYQNPNYDPIYWKFFANSVNDIQSYKRQTAQKWIANELNVKNTLKKYEIIMNSVETGITNGSLNTLDLSPDFDKLVKYSISCLTMSFQLFAIHLEMFMEFKRICNVSISEDIMIYKERTVQNIEESEKLLVKFIYKFVEDIPNFSYANYSIDGSFDRRITESRSETANETQRKITFMSCIKHHINGLKF